MAIDTTFSASRRRNVMPKSSVLQTYTKDIDCSGLTKPPEDGEFIIVQGTTALKPVQNKAIFTGANNAAVTAELVHGANLRMVWGSALRSDRTAQNHTRTTVFHGGSIEVDCKLFDADIGVALNGAGNYPVGSVVSVRKAVQALEGSTADPGANDATEPDTRLVLSPVTEDGCMWAVGVVTATSSTAVPKNGDSVRVRLYDAPIYIAKSA